MRISEDLRSLRLTLRLYLFIFALKLGVYFASNVMALLAEAFHTLADILVTGFLLMATIYSQREPDRVHMFGYGRTQNAAALVAATLFISFTSYKLYEEAIPRLFQPETVEHKNLWLAFGILVISILIAAVPLVRLLRQEERGPAAKAQFMELVNDELGLIAALIGTLFIMLGQPLADPIAAIIVATIIAYNGVRLFRENFSYLLGRAPEVKILEEIERLALSVQEVHGVHDLRAEYVGPETLHAGLHIEVDGTLSVHEANRVAQEAQRRIHQAIESGYCYIHVDAFRADKGSFDNESCVKKGE